MKKLILLTLVAFCFTVLGCSKGLTEPTSLKNSHFGVAAMWMVKPNYESCYSLNQMQVWQKVPNGYLLSFDSPYRDESQPVMLITDESYSQGHVFWNKYAYYAGNVTYTTMTGFEKTVQAYRIYHGVIIN